jgi:hypothetical protein
LDSSLCWVKELLLLVLQDTGGKQHRLCLSVRVSALHDFIDEENVRDVQQSADVDTELLYDAAASFAFRTASCRSGRPS